MGGDVGHEREGGEKSCERGLHDDVQKFGSSEEGNMSGSKDAEDSSRAVGEKERVVKHKSS